MVLYGRNFLQLLFIACSIGEEKLSKLVEASIAVQAIYIKQH